MANTEGLKRYIVGGYVRDSLLGRPTHDRDFVVVGATHDEMVERGFLPVGAAFKVYLDPETGDEHALARTEKKVGIGHTGFETYAEPDVTLEDDLRRRDFTINAMALEAETGRLVDPYGGYDDLNNGVLKAVNPKTFSEDPLRVLRAARFASVLRFKVESLTTALAIASVANGDLTTLSAERVYKEATRAMLESDQPSKFWWALRAIRALEDWFPELEAMIGVEHGHKEGDVWVHTMMALDKLHNKTEQTVWATLYHDVGKVATPREQWPRHYNHEVVGVDMVESALLRLRAPRKVVDFAKTACRQHMRVHNWRQLRASTVVDLIRCSGNTANLVALLDVFDADSRGRTTPRSYELELHARRVALLGANVAYNLCSGKEVLAHRREQEVTLGLPEKAPGKWVGERLHQMRVSAVKQSIGRYFEAEIKAEIKAEKKWSNR